MPLPDVEAQYVRHLGPVDIRASVTFVGVEPVELLRIYGGELVHYATLGMSRHPMVDPAAEIVTDDGPRAELVLSLRGREDRHGIVRGMATLASTPAVEGVVVAAGTSLDLGEPLWDDSRFSSVLVMASGVLVPDVGDVRIHPVVPMTANEAAWKRVHGADQLERLWSEQSIDLRDAERPSARLE